MRDIKPYKVIIEIDEDGIFIGRVPSLPGCYTQAKSMIQLKKRITEAIQLCLEVAEVDSDYNVKLI